MSPPQSHIPVPSRFTNGTKGVCLACVFPTGRRSLQVQDLEGLARVSAPGMW